MGRNHADWLQAYIDYASVSEAPTYMHFWSGVSAIAGALRRKVWFDMGHFEWYPNFYIVFVAPPGIIAKSTTSGIAMNLLRKVPGVRFGPDIVTWPSLVTSFAEAAETFEHQDAHHLMSCLTLESSEFGNLLDPSDRKMVDLLVHLWDGKPGDFKKQTKGSGNDEVPNPWINIIACTTPSWIAGNFPEYMIGGGFTSRCVFVYADAKAKIVPYPKLVMQYNKAEAEAKLLEDLVAIGGMRGGYELSREAQAWGIEWYKELWQHKPVHLDNDQFGGYLSRKQSHIHKLAMVLAASTSDELTISREHLTVANAMTTDLEKDMEKVFSKIGKSSTSLYVDRMLAHITGHGKLPYTEVYRFIHTHFPSARDFEDVIAGCIKSGKLKINNENGILMVYSLCKKEAEGV